MKYPEYIKKDDYIGVTAPSAGITDEGKLKRLDNVKNNLKQLGYKYIETENVRHDFKGRSSSAEQRAEQFMSLWEKENVSAIISASGGDFLFEMLEHINWNKLSISRPKWFQGYSDNTSLGFILTTMLDIATIYGDNIGSFGMEHLFKTQMDSIRIMEGKKVIQESFEKYQKEKLSEQLLSYNLSEKNIWKTVDDKEMVNIKGRCLGRVFRCNNNDIGYKI